MMSHPHITADVEDSISSSSYPLDNLTVEIRKVKRDEVSNDLRSGEKEEEEEDLHLEIDKLLGEHEAGGDSVDDQDDLEPGRDERIRHGRGNRSEMDYQEGDGHEKGEEDVSIEAMVERVSTDPSVQARPVVSLYPDSIEMDRRRARSD